MSEASSEIVQFYKNQTIFLTGATGFLGKVILEKLLRVCDVRTVFILVRPKKGKTSHERFDDLLKLPCFEPLLKLKTMDEIKSKLAMIEGDCDLENLGISTSSLDTLKNQVTCVIHTAANVRFNQSFKVAGCNVRAVWDVLELAKQMPNLKAFVHVSTAFSNCIRNYIKEDFYQSPVNPKALLAFTSEYSDKIMASITAKLIGDWPNAYTYGKCVAENVIKDNSGDIPVAIVRPAIVANCFDEPIPGWVDNFYGVLGIVIAAALGVLRSFHARKNSPAYLVPCDYVSNLVLSSAWALQKNKTISGKIPIYNMVGSNRNLLTWQKLQEGLENCAMDYPSEKVVWYYCFNMRENKNWHKICIFFLHTVPAYLVDFILICIRKPPLAVSNYARLNKLLDMLSYFATNSWTFETENVETLHERMTAVDRQLFKFNMGDIVWNERLRTSVIGGRVYLLKDPIDTVPKWRRKYRILRICHYCLVAFIFYMIYSFVKIIFLIVF